MKVNTYDEYGVPGSANVGRFQYTGQAWLPEAGLYYYKARMYSPTNGRFLQTDPIGYGDGLNMYAYVGNDPVNGVDPTGLSCTLAGATSPSLDINDRETCEDQGGEWVEEVIITAQGPDDNCRAGWTCVSRDEFMDFARDEGLVFEFPDTWDGITEVAYRDDRAPQRDESEELGLLACLTDAGGAALTGFLSPEEQAAQLAGAAATTLFEADSARREAARGRPSGTFGRGNATIVPGSNVRLSPGEALARGAKRFVPGYAVFSGAVALVNAGVAAYNSEGCRNLVE